MKRTYKIQTVTREEPYRQSVWHWVGWDDPATGWSLAYYGSFDSWQDADDARAELQGQEDAYQEFFDDLSTIWSLYPSGRRTDAQKAWALAKIKELFDACPMEAKRYEDEQSGYEPDGCVYSRYVEGTDE